MKAALTLMEAAAEFRATKSTQGMNLAIALLLYEPKV
jgi:hypothetical protein